MRREKDGERALCGYGYCGPRGCGRRPGGCEIETVAVIDMGEEDKEEDTGISRRCLTEDGDEPPCRRSLGSCMNMWERKN